MNSITQSFRRPKMRAKIMSVLPALCTKVNVTKTEIAKRAGVSQSSITFALSEGDKELQDALNSVLGSSPKEKILFAIDFFRKKGVKANARMIARKACVSFGSLYYVAKHSPAVKKGLAELKKVSSLDKILDAIKKLRTGQHPLSRKIICETSGVSVRMYNKLKRKRPEIDLEIELGFVPRNAEGRVRRAVKFLSRRDNLVVTRKMICHFAKVDKTTLSRLENNPNRSIKVIVEEIIPLSSDQKIEMAIRSLVLKGQPLDYKHIAKQSGLTLRTIYNRMKANSLLGKRLADAQKKRAQLKQSITMKDSL